MDTQLVKLETQVVPAAAMELYNPKFYVSCIGEQNLYIECLNIVDVALMYKNIQKPEKEATLMAIQLQKKLQASYSHITIKKIQDILLEYNYGEDTYVSVDGLVRCLEKYGLSRECKENKNKLYLEQLQKEEELRQQKHQKEIEEFNKIENVIIRCNNRLKEFKEESKYFDYFSETFQLILEYDLYEWTDEDIEMADDYALVRTRAEISKKRIFHQDHAEKREVRSIENILNQGFDYLRKNSSYERYNKESLTKIAFNYMIREGISDFKKLIDANQ